MAGYALIAIEGVLARDGSERLPGTPIAEGIRLYEALRKVHKVVLLTTMEPGEKIDHWLLVNGVRDHLSVSGRSAVYDSVVDLRKQQISELRTLGYNVELVVDSSPAVIAEAMRLGVTSLLFASPVYARPEFRPGARREIREWGAMEAEVESQATLRKRVVSSTADMAD